MTAATMTTFRDRLDGAVAANQSLLCVGLDPEHGETARVPPLPATPRRR